MAAGFAAGAFAGGAGGAALATGAGLGAGAGVATAGGGGGSGAATTFFVFCCFRSAMFPSYWIYFADDKIISIKNLS